MRKPLTARQQEIYDFIAGEIRQRGMPPTIREIGDRFGMRSSNGAREALNALARKGYVRRHDRLSRGIELVEPVEVSHRVLVSGGKQVPLIERLASPTVPVSEAVVSRYLIVDSSLLPRDGTPFAILVPDDSLYASGVRVGDYAVAVTVPPQSNGDIAVVLVGSRLLVRRYRVVDSVVSLEADRNGEGSLALGGVPPVHLIGQVQCIVRTVNERRG